MLQLCLLVVLAAWLLYRFKLKGLFSYWALRGVPGPKTSAPFGNFSDVFLGKKSSVEFITDVYKEYPKEQYVGTQIVNTPLLHIHDPEIIRQVFVKEFHDFSGRGMYSGTDEDFLFTHLFSMSGAPWRNMRVKLSPTFSTGKLKYMFSMIKECGKQLDQHLSARLREGNGRLSVDIKDLAARFTTDIIASVAFGVQSNCINDPKSEFRDMGHRMLKPSFRLGIVSLLAFFWPRAMRALSYLGVHFVEKDVAAFFSKTVWDIVEYREKNGVQRADMLDLLIKLKNEGYLPPDSGDKEEAIDDSGLTAPQARKKLTLKELAAQCAVFLVAGFDTSTSTILFSLYLMAKNQHVQEKAVADIQNSLQRHGGKVSYDMLMDLPYVDMVINETLRLYPAVPFLTREAMTARNLPSTDVNLEKGQRLVIPVQALHMDPKYWKNPNEFNPERFTKENVAARKPMTYMPFGDGPRICIGMRMAMVQVKMALLTILTRARVAVAPDMPKEVTLDPRCILPSPVHGCRLVLSARK